MGAIFPGPILEQEMSAERWIAIPEEVRQIYALWRPSPLCRAVRLEQALGTPAKIFYKYEGVSPAGSHKPNSAVPQAYYNKQAGTKRLTTETGAGQWGSSIAFAGQMFGLPVRVYMVKVSYEQKPYPPLDDADLGRRGVRQPDQPDQRRPRRAGRRPGQPGLARPGHLRSGRRSGSRSRHQLHAGLGAQPRAAAPERHRPRSQEAVRQDRPLPRRDLRPLRRRLQLRRHRLPLPRRQGGRRQARREGALRGGRADLLPDADQGRSMPTTTATPPATRR
jgi:hypothetical protein